MVLATNQVQTLSLDNVFSTAYFTVSNNQYENLDIVGSMIVKMQATPLHLIG